MCRVLHVHILNGRGFQDRESHINCISGNGSSVVDYCIASGDLFKFVVNFEDLNNSNSDHFPLSCSLKLPVSTDYESNDDSPDKYIQNIESNAFKPLIKFYWNENKRDKFVSLFNLKFNLSYDDIVYLIDTNINEVISMFNDMYTQTDTELSMKCKSKLINLEYSRAKKQPVWWADELQVVKDIKYTSLRLYRNTNSINDLKIYKENKKKFEVTCKKKKNILCAKSRQELIACRNDPKAFWNLLRRRLNPKAVQPLISGQTWFIHFSNLLIGNEIFDYNFEDLNPNNNHNDILNTQILEDETQAAIKKINPSKSPGPDGILGHCITSTQHVTIPILTRLFNAVFNTGEFPNLWLENIIT